MGKSQNTKKAKNARGERPKKANLFNPNCPSRDVLELIGSKWSMLLLCALYDRKTRTGQLKRMVGGISQKMLTQTLREMQRDGLVRRISYPEVPPRVEYELTELGYSLGELVVKMERWIVNHHFDILKARKFSAPIS
jgi:DNA-binding HxlR family transcriptional regulator